MFASERRMAKVLNFSIAYGKTEHGLSKVRLGKPDNDSPDSDSRKACRIPPRYPIAFLTP